MLHKHHVCKACFSSSPPTQAWGRPWRRRHGRPALDPALPTNPLTVDPRPAARRASEERNATPCMRFTQSPGSGPCPLCSRCCPLSALSVPGSQRLDQLAGRLSRPAALPYRSRDSSRLPFSRAQPGRGRTRHGSHSHHRRQAPSRRTHLNLAGKEYLADSRCSSQHDSVVA